MSSEPKRQFVACVFNECDARSYTYHNDGEPVAVGDRVRVESRSGEGVVTVVKLVDEAPPFPTKPILGLVPAAETAEAPL